MKYIPNTGKIAESMLQEMGLRSIDDLLSQIPSSLRNRQPLKNIPIPQSELELRRRFSALAQKNPLGPNRIFCGAGIYAHDIPAAIDAISSRAEFLTSYTPYQPEISQGTLISIFEFQTMISRLFQMEVTNASMYDGSTSFSEALLMAKRLRPDANQVVVSSGIHPEVLQTAQTSLEGMGIEWTILPLNQSGITDFNPSIVTANPKQILAVAVQTPNYLGMIENLEHIRSHWPAWGSSQSSTSANADQPLFVVHTGDPHAFALIQPPGDAGADIVTAEGQPLGCYPAYGGPSVGLFSSRLAFVRQMPGRLVGKTKDAAGLESFCLTLSTREQHIRREKATSNICTNQGWCALRVAMYLSMRGPEGLADVAEQSLSKANYLAQKLSALSGVELLFKDGFFNEFVIRAERLNERISACESTEIAPGIALAPVAPQFSEIPGIKSSILICVSELMSKSDLDDYVAAFSLGGVR